MIGVRLPHELEDKMSSYIKKAKMTKSQFVKQAVSDYLRQHELRILHDEMTLKGRKEIKKGHGIPGEMVMRLLEKWS